MPNINSKLSVSGNKYTFVTYDGDYRIHVLRHSEPWLIIERGHNAIWALLHECIDAKEELARLKSMIDVDEDDDELFDDHPGIPDSY